MPAKSLFRLAWRWLPALCRHGAIIAALGPGARHFAARRRASPTRPCAALAALLACFVSGPAPAQADGAKARGEAVLGSDGAASSRCVIVEIAGHRSGHLDCASQRLQDAARIARDQARRAIEVPQAGSPDVTVGVSSLSGTRLRMGNALGTSVHPQRPIPTFAPPRLGAPQ